MSKKKRTYTIKKIVPSVPKSSIVLIDSNDPDNKLIFAENVNAEVNDDPNEAGYPGFVYLWKDGNKEPIDFDAWLGSNTTPQELYDVLVALAELVKRTSLDKK